MAPPGNGAGPLAGYRILELRQQGVTIVTLPAADKKKLAELTADTGAVWAEQLDKRGKPGTEVFKAFRAALPPAK